MASEPQTVRDCAALRQACRDAIFEKMDEQHGETLDAIADIRVKLAETNGAKMERETSCVVSASRRFSWKEVAAIIAVTVAAIGAAIGAIWKGISP